MAKGDKKYAGTISGAALRRNLKDVHTQGNWNAKDSWLFNHEQYSLTAVFDEDDQISHFELARVYDEEQKKWVAELKD